MVGDGMPPTNPEARRPRWPAGFLGMLGLLLAVESGLARAANSGSGRWVRPTGA